MTTLLAAPMVFESRCWTPYSSANRRPSSGVRKPWNALGLFAEVAAVHQEEHAPRAGVLDEAVDRGDGEDRLARPGGHLDEGPGAVVLERVLQFANGLDLVGVEELPRPRLQLRQRPQPRAEG